MIRTSPILDSAKRKLGRAAFRGVKRVAAEVEKDSVPWRTVYCGDHELLVRLPNGVHCYVDMRDVTVAPFLALGEPYEPHVAAALMGLTRPGDTFFDVGANFGYHSLMIVRQLAKNAGSAKDLLHLFEPNPIVFRYLQRTVHANGMWKTIKLNQLAVSNGPGNANLKLFGDLWGGASLLVEDLLSVSERPWLASAPDGAKIVDVVEVETISLDDYCDDAEVEQIHLMKIDIEGFEDQAFAGMKRVLDRSHELCIVMEFTPSAYREASQFWSDLAREFPNRYAISRNHGLEPIDTLAELSTRMEGEYANILLSRRFLD